MAKKQIEKDIESWLEDIPDDCAEAMLDIASVEDGVVSFQIGEDERKFTLSFPSDYPKNKEGNYLIFSEDSALTKWAQELNDYAEKKGIKLTDVLEQACSKYLKLDSTNKGKQEDDDDDAMNDEDDHMFGFSNEPAKKDKPKKSEAELAIENKVANKEFLEIGSPQATLRILNDLKAIRKIKPEDLGFSADPVVEAKSGLENLYHWHIKIFGLDKASDLAKDIATLKKKNGMDHILLEMRFSKEYPHVPPFVRVVKPRFVFRTGHVTLGGSICMELLTKSGWSAINDIESILVQIIAELTSGGARLDFNYGNYEYTEQEAWEAFYRAASTHGWDVKGLSKDAFPKVTS